MYYVCIMLQQTGFSVFFICKNYHVRDLNAFLEHEGSKYVFISTYLRCRCVETTLNRKAFAMIQIIILIV